MNKVTFNNSLDVICPLGFRELSKEENNKYFYGNQLRLTFRNDEKHIIISLSTGKRRFINYILSLGVVLTSSLSNLEQSLKDYEYIKEYQSIILDKEATTACFSYTAKDQDVKQYGELTVFRYGRAIYAIYFLSRFDNKEESEAIFKEFRESIKEAE